MFDRLSKEQFNYVIEAMCLYKTLNPDKIVTLSEKTAKEVISFFNREGRQYGPMLNAMAESGLSMEELVQKSKEEIEKQSENKIEEVDDEEVDDEEVDDEEVDDDSD
tara:strand:- start:283 stop:603 length:321 start_codon:yes stop_codon:yes gene_type:complete